MAKEAENKEIKMDPMKDLVTVTLPRATGKEENYVFASLNGKGYTIMRGVPVRVPRPVADILRESQRMTERLGAFQDAQAAQMGRLAASGAV